MPSVAYISSFFSSILFTPFFPFLVSLAFASATAFISLHQELFDYIRLEANRLLCQESCGGELKSDDRDMWWGVMTVVCGVMGCNVWWNVMTVMCDVWWGVMFVINDVVWWLWCVVRCGVMGGEVWCLWCVMCGEVWWLWCVVCCSVSWGVMTVVCGEVW